MPDTSQNTQHTHIPRLSAQVFKSCLQPLTHRDLAAANPANQNTEHWDLAEHSCWLCSPTTDGMTSGVSRGQQVAGFMQHRYKVVFNVSFKVCVHLCSLDVMKPANVDERRRSEVTSGHLLCFGCGRVLVSQYLCVSLCCFGHLPAFFFSDIFRLMWLFHWHF